MLRTKRTLVFTVLLVCSALNSPASEIQVDFSKKGDNFRAVVKGLQSEAYTYFEDTDKLILDILGDTVGSPEQFDLPGEMVSSVEIASHPMLDGVTRITFHYDSADLLNVEDESDGLIVTFKKLPEIVGAKTEAGVQRDGKRNERKGNYVLGTGDKVRIEVYGYPELSTEKVIAEDGRIPFAFVGDIEIGDLSVDQAGKKIERILKNGYLVNPVVSLSVLEYKSQWAYVTGNVEKPGMIYLEGPTKLVEMLSEIGGTSGQHIVVKKGAYSDGGNGEVIRVGKKELYSENSDAADIIIEHGDLIEVPQSYYYVSGEIGHPGAYEFKDNMTIYKAIIEAGGLGEWGSKKNVEILRTENGEQARLEANLSKIEKGKMEDIPLKPEDHIIVHRRTLF